MNLSESSLTDLVAELRERLRHFTAGPPGETAAADTPGPLGPGGRAALAARLLGVVLAARQGRDAAQAARSFEELAESLSAAPAPLPGSAWEADLALLSSAFETIASAWDRGDNRALARTWRDLRVVGDRLWTDPTEVPPSTARRTPVVSAAPRPVGDDDSPPAVRPEVWLLVAGSLRRTSLRKRLVAAGLVVDCPADIETVTRRLQDERPAALICDDAAPARFRSRLLGVLPETAPQVILIRSRTSAVDPGGAVWLPPHDIDDLLAFLAE